MKLADDGIPVAVACRVLNTSRSGYYDWPRPARAHRGDLRNKELLKVIRGNPRRFPRQQLTGHPASTPNCALGMSMEVNRKRV